MKLENFSGTKRNWFKTIFKKGDFSVVKYDYGSSKYLAVNLPVYNASIYFSLADEQRVEGMLPELLSINESNFIEVLSSFQEGLKTIDNIKKERGLTQASIEKEKEKQIKINSFVAEMAKKMTGKRFYGVSGKPLNKLIDIKSEALELAQSLIKSMPMPDLEVIEWYGDIYLRTKIGMKYYALGTAQINPNNTPILGYSILVRGDHIDVDMLLCSSTSIKLERYSALNDDLCRVLGAKKINHEEFKDHAEETYTHHSNGEVVWVGVNRAIQLKAGEYTHIVRGKTNQQITDENYAAWSSFSKGRD